MAKMTDVSSHESCSCLYQPHLLYSCKIHPSYEITEVIELTTYDLEFGKRKDLHLSSSCELLLNNSSCLQDDLVA